MNSETTSSGQLCVQLEFVKRGQRGGGEEKNVDEIIVRIFQNFKVE